MSQVSVHIAQTNLSQLIERVHAGEEIIIAQGEKPVARLVSIAPTPKGRIFGILKGLGKVDEAFFDPLPEEELRSWEGG